MERNLSSRPGPGGAWSFLLILSLLMIDTEVVRSRTDDPGEARSFPRMERIAPLDEEPEHSPEIGIPASSAIVPERQRPALPPLFQTSANVTWLAGGGSDGLGMTNLNLSGVLRGAIPGWGLPVMLSPSFRVNFLNGPDGIDLPSQLYAGSLSLSVVMPITPKATVIVGITPGFSSDLEASGSDVFRWTAHAMVNWQWTPTVQLMFGVAYLNRNDLLVLPVGGLVWTPNDCWRVEVTAPRPRVAHRVDWLGSEQGSDWVYFAAELGGGTWAVQRANGLNDELTLRDFRLILGWERKATEGLSAQLEAGYVFGRTIEYESDGQEFEPENTWMLRAGFRY